MREQLKPYRLILTADEKRRALQAYRRMRLETKRRAFGFWLIVCGCVKPSELEKRA